MLIYVDMLYFIKYVHHVTTCSWFQKTAGGVLPNVQLAFSMELSVKVKSIKIRQRWSCSPDLDVGFSQHTWPSTHPWLVLSQPAWICFWDTWKSTLIPKCVMVYKRQIYANITIITLEYSFRPKIFEQKRFSSRYHCHFEEIVSGGSEMGGFLLTFSMTRWKILLFTNGKTDRLFYMASTQTMKSTRMIL